MALPTPTALTGSTRYFVAGTRRYVWVPTIAVKTAPTTSEITAGTELTGEVVAGSVNGFNVATTKQDVPDAGSRFTGSIPGRTASDDSSMEFYASSNSTDVRGTLTKDLNGFMVIFPEGIVTGSKCDVFPARVSSVSSNQDTEDSGKITVDFAVTSTPAQGVTTPTA